MCVRVRVKCKEDEVMSRIRDAEHSQLVERMRRRIAELHIEVYIRYLCLYYAISDWHRGQ